MQLTAPEATPAGPAPSASATLFQAPAPSAAAAKPPSLTSDPRRVIRSFSMSRTVLAEAKTPVRVCRRRLMALDQLGPVAVGIAHDTEL